MPERIPDLSELQQYLDGVMGRAEHHARDVRAAALTLAGAVVWRHDPGSLEAKTYQGEVKNVLWFKVRGVRYCLRFDHKRVEIDLLQDSQQGRLVTSFHDETPPREIQEVFAKL